MSGALQGHKRGCRCVGCSPATRAKGMRALKRAKRNPGAKWHNRMMLRSHDLAEKTDSPILRESYMGRYDAHAHSVIESEKRGMNPKTSKMYRVSYKSNGKIRKTGFFATKEEAEKSANFLKWQGAKNIKIVKSGALRGMNPGHIVTGPRGGKYKVTEVKPPKGRQKFAHERVVSPKKIPRSWKYGTIPTDSHRVVMAFPPGRRRKGAGVVQAILHPAKEKRQSNPIKEEKLWKKIGYPFLPATIEGQMIVLRKVRDSLKLPKDAKLIGDINDLMDKLVRGMKHPSHLKNPVYKCNHKIIGTLPGHLDEIRYKRTKDSPGLYKHAFGKGAKIHALADGSLLIKGKKKLWMDNPPNDSYRNSLESKISELLQALKKEGIIRGPRPDFSKYSTENLEIIHKNLLQTFFEKK